MLCHGVSISPCQSKVQRTHAFETSKNTVHCTDQHSCTKRAPMYATNSLCRDSPPSGLDQAKAATHKQPNCILYRLAPKPDAAKQKQAKTNSMDFRQKWPSWFCTTKTPETGQSTRTQEAALGTTRAPRPAPSSNQLPTTPQHNLLVPPRP